MTVYNLVGKTPEELARIDAEIMAEAEARQAALRAGCEQVGEVYDSMLARCTAPGPLAEAEKIFRSVPLILWVAGLILVLALKR